MKNIYKFLSVFLLLMMTGCQLVYYLQVNERHDDNLSEIKEYLDKNQISSFDYSLKLIDSLGYLMHTEKHMVNTWKLERGGEASAVELKIYNPGGALINAYSQCFGPFKKLNILDSYPPRTIPHLPINYDLKFTDELKLWDIDNEMKNQLVAESKESTYIFVMYWNIWTKQFTRVVLKALESYMTTYDPDRTKFLYILVNNARESMPQNTEENNLKI